MRLKHGNNQTWWNFENGGTAKNWFPIRWTFGALKDGVFKIIKNGFQIWKLDKIVVLMTPTGHHGNAYFRFDEQKLLKFTANFVEFVGRFFPSSLSSENI